MNEAPELLLELAVAEGLRLSNQQRQLRIQPAASLERVLDRVDQVRQVHDRLAAARDVAREGMARGLALVDALDVVSQRNRVAHIVVDARDPQQHDGHVSPLLPQELLGPDLRARVVPLWVERRIFGDRVPRLRRRVHEDRAGEDELFHLEVLQAMQQALGAAYRDLLVLGARLAREIVGRGEVDHRCDALAIRISVRAPGHP